MKLAFTLGQNKGLEVIKIGKIWLAMPCLIYKAELQLWMISIEVKLAGMKIGNKRPFLALHMASAMFISF